MLWPADLLVIISYRWFKSHEQRRAPTARKEPPNRFTSFSVLRSREGWKIDFLSHDTKFYNMIVYNII